MRLIGALLALVLLAAFAAMFVVPLFDIGFRATFRRLAFRNINRRRGEAALVVIGALLGTAIITASFVVGDTIEGAIRDAARTQLGPIDETVRVTDAAQLDATYRAITAPPIPGVDGALRITSAGAVIATTDESRVAVPAAGLLEIDFDAGRAFGRDPGITGLADAGPTPTGDEAVIGRHLADRLGVRAGDPIDAFAYGVTTRLVVREVIDDVGLAGYVPVRATGGTRPLGVFVAPGTIEAMRQGATGAGAGAGAGAEAGAGAGAGAQLPTTEVVVSNDGGVFDSTGTAAADRAKAELDARVATVPGTQVLTLKADLLDQAKSTGEGFTQLFSTIGYFSVIAGILLLVNLFVMLAEERKGELGMLRALGFKRNHLVRTFAIEGSTYSFVAAIVGAIVGIAVSKVIILAAANIFSRGNADLSFPLVVRVPALVRGGFIGLAISVVTVWGTSARITRLNIIRAIRDLPEPRTERHGRRAFLLGTAGAVVSLLAFGAAWSAGNAALIIAALPVTAFCLIPVLGRFLPRRPVIVSASVFSLVWGIGVFTFAGTKVGRAGIQVFVVQGIVLVAAGVVLLSQADRVWAALSRWVSSGGRGLASRLGLAYPLARRFRTGMLLAMFAIVIFTMTFISVLSAIFGDQAPEFTDNVRGGYDLIVDSNQGNPVTVEQLRSQPDVVAVAPLTRTVGRATTPKRPEGANVGVTGFDERFLAYGQPTLESRRAQDASDADTYRAVLADPSLIVVNQNFGGRGQVGGPPQANLVVGDVVTLENTASGATKQLTVAGIMANDFVGNGGMVGTDVVTDLFAPRTVQNRDYVKVRDGADPAQVAARLSGALVPNGVDARTFRSIIDDLLATQLAFFSLLRGYLGLGLLIGIAGLGVVMVRAVRERRREIGMLRAMGFSSGIVRRSFVLEATFVALQGIALGVALGMVTAYNLLENSDTFGDQRIAVSWPWVALVVIAVIPLVAALLATAWPATQAARIKPAVALRIAD